MFGARKKSKRFKKGSKASKGGADLDEGAAKAVADNVERTVQAKIGEKIWVSIAKEEDYSYLWQLFEVASLSTDKTSVFVSDKFTGTINEVQAAETLSFDPCHDENFSDLTRMNYLHEASLLYSLNKRYMENNIYTWFGDTLISMNPYVDIPGLYSKEVDPEEPHVFSVADRSYGLLKQKRRSQSIIINGDSGAGKTEAAKQMMRHLVNLASSQSETPQIEELVLSSTPVLEAFGNSITLRNDNSSRFGRFIQILYSDDGTTITGMNTKHFLLEKSRLITRSPGERNYHIFYQVASMNAEELGFHTPDEYTYLQPVLNADNYRGTIPNDKKQFELTEQALENIGIVSEVRSEIWRIILAILSLGNIDFIPDENDTNNTGKCKLTPESTEYLEKVCEMLGIEVESLGKCLVVRTIQAKDEITEIELTVEQARDSRDALAKFLYSTLFDWLILELNRQSAIKAQGSKQQGSKNSRKKEKFIGILDIFGFEDLEHNSFEQICVNYANELLQNQFDLHIIASERKLFHEEGVQFPDIQLPSIVAAEQVLGTLNDVVFSKLEEQCMLKSGTDKGFLSNLNSNDVKKNTKLKMDWKLTTNFVISHFAGEVSYNSEGFLAKNRDSLVDDLKQAVFETNNNILVSHLGIEKMEKKKNNKMANKETVLKGFQQDMRNLISTITSTDARFVRCIKPNHAQNEKDWDVKLILSQLEYLGINQAIRVHDETYPVRRPFGFIPEKYLFLFDDLGMTYLPGSNDKEVMRAILFKALGMDSEFKLWQCGHTKVFLGNQVLFQLDALVNEKRKAQLAAMSEEQRELELEKERERQREELRLAKLKMEQDNELILQQQKERFEEKEKLYKLQLAQKEEKLNREVTRVRTAVEKEYRDREERMKKNLEEQFKMKEETRLAVLQEKITFLEARNKDLEEEDKQRERDLEAREREVETKLQKAETLVAKHQLAIEQAQQTHALSKEETEKNQKLQKEKLLDIEKREKEFEDREQKASKEKHEEELAYQKKVFLLELELEKMKTKEQAFELEKKRFEKEKSRVLKLETQLQENEKKREEQQAEKMMQQAAQKREKNAKRLRKAQYKGAVLMQKLIRGFIIRRNYRDMLARSVHFEPILKEQEKVVFSSIVFNVKPVSKGSKTKRRVLLLTSKRRLLLLDPLSFKIDQSAIYDPEFCRSTATGQQGMLHIYLKSDWLATSSSEWVVRDILNSATAWGAVLSSLTDYSEYIRHSFFNIVKPKGVKRKELLYPLKFGQLKMDDEHGVYEAGEKLKTKKGKVSGGAYFVLFRRKTKYSITWFPDEKADVPGGEPVPVDRTCKVLVPDHGAVNGKFNIFMFCLLVKKKKAENMVSFETKGIEERDAWANMLKPIIKRDLFRTNDSDKIRKKLLKRAASSQNFRKSNSIESRNSRAARASNTLKGERVSESRLLIVEDNRFPSTNSKNTMRKRASTKGRKSNSRPLSNLERIQSKKSMNGRTSKKRSMKRFGSKKSMKPASTFHASDFLNGFEQADTSSYASMKALKKN